MTTAYRSKILVVDDEPANRRLLVDILRREGFDVVVAAGGLEALAVIAQEPVDVVLLDLMMPEVDGMTVLAELRERRLLPALPVVVVTAHEDRRVRIDALSAGAIDFLTKPIDREEVVCKAKTLAELKHLRDIAKADGASARAQLRAMAENAPDIVASVDRNGIVLFVNQALPQATRDQVVGSSLISLLQPDCPESVQAALDDVLHTGRNRVFEARTRSPDGAVLSFEAHAGPVRLAGEVVGAVIVARDVTEKKRTETHLLISDRMASVGTLAAGVAHEINNPLAALIANLDFAGLDLEMIANELGEDSVRELREVLRDATDAAERIRLIVRDLKLFSRAEQAERVTPVDVTLVLESTLRMAHNEIRHRAKLVTDYGKIPLVLGNESRLGQVFLNLIVNAAQAIPEGDARHNEIHVSSAVDAAGRIHVEIRDTGAGMPPEVLDRLFTPFFTTKPVGIGTGLGLSICQRIVAAMGGEIRVESQLGRGTTFRVFLPPAAPDARVALPAPAPPPTLAPRRGRVLVIDDEPMIGEVVRRTLAKEHDVTVVELAQHALDLILSARSPFDVIFCDLMMPQMTGMDLYEQLVARGATEATARMVFLTGGAFTQRAREFLDQVPNERLDKPFDMLALRRLVNERVR